MVRKKLLFTQEIQISCPENRGNINVNKFKGEINCPKFSDTCDFKNNIMCNEMFDCIKKRFETQKNNEQNIQNIQREQKKNKII